jgi:hypothetical protein
MYSRILFKASINVLKSWPKDISFDKELAIMGGNTGNLLFTNAITQYATSTGTSLSVDTDDLCRLDHPGGMYDACIINCANWINPQCRKLLRILGDQIQNSKIPVFLLGIGAQAPTSTSFAYLDIVRAETKALVRAVLNTGGGLGLRGEYTAGFLQNLGFNNLSIIGCPSLFQKGKNLTISSTRADRESFIPSINGSAYARDICFAKMYTKYRGSQYICQDDLYKVLLHSTELTSSEKHQLLSYPDEFLNLIIEDRVQIFRDLSSWLNHFSKSKINFSFGNKIHGNFAAILSGVPAFIHTFDSRTRELAEFYGIPNRQDMCWKTSDDLYDLYSQCDYTKFNKMFPSLYDNFCNFLIKNNLGLIPGPSNLFEVATRTLSAPPVPVGQDLKRMIKEYLAFTPAKLLRKLNVDRRKLFIVKNMLKSL